jgi:type VI secretion system protein VasG
VQVELKPLLKRLNRFSTAALEGAAGVCVSRGHYEVAVEHMLLRMVADPNADLALILDRFEADPGRLEAALQRAVEGFRSGNQGKPVFSPILIEWIQDAWMLASIELGHAEIRSGALIAALVSRRGRYLAGDHPELEKVRAEELRRSFLDVVAGSSEEAGLLREGPPSTGVAAPAGGPGGPQTALGRFAVNFTARAKAGEIDPVFGRDREIRQMIDILARRRKNNPIVVGEAGVGKTAVVEGMALRIVEDDVPDLLRGVQLYGLDMGLLQAGAGVKGEFENRIKSVIDEVKASTVPVILFIDEAHTLIGAGNAPGAGDAANLLKPALARGELKTIAATTWAEYKKYFEEDAALARRFQLVKLDEPSAEDAAIMLRGLRVKYEEAHNVHIRDDAVAAAAQLSSRYISGRQLPDKAVDLLDTAAARIKIGLTARPAALENLERHIQALEREQGAMERDRESGIAIDEERVAALAGKLEESGAELRRREEAWQREKTAVERILELRRRITGAEAEAAAEAPEEAPAAQPETAAAEEAGTEAAEEAAVPAVEAPASEPDGGVAELSAEEAKAELSRALEELAEIQGDEPMIPLEVDPKVIAQVIGDWTGIPVGKMVRDEASLVLDMKNRLAGRIKGQDHALESVAQALQAAKAGLQDPGKPMGVFLLVGPSGVGKTETGLALANLMFGGERFIVSINMSEFQDREMGVSGLVGAKPGYVGYGKGGTLTEAVRQRPYSVVLLDEIEKACQEVRNLFYQVFDKGVLTDGTGREIDFKNTVILITSNLGLDIVQQMCAAGPVPDPDEIVEAIRPTLSKALQPAWLARCTIVPYFNLGADALREITALKMAKVARRMAASHRITLDYDDAVLDQVADRCTEVETGARNIDYILEGTLLPMISTAILEKMAEEAMPERLTIGVAEGGGFELRVPGQETESAGVAEAAGSAKAAEAAGVIGEEA